MVGGLLRGSSKVRKPATSKKAEKRTSKAASGQPQGLTEEEIKEIFEDFGVSNPKQSRLRGFTPKPPGQTGGIAPKNMTPELIRNWLHFASPAGRLEYIKALIFTLDEVPNDVRHELELVSLMVKAGDYPEARVRLRDLVHWYNSECKRLEKGTRTDSRSDRVHKREFMAWAASADSKVASNLDELSQLPHFNPQWLRDNALSVVRRWAREAGFQLKAGRPAGKLKKIS
jgi:hypothetical protein